MNRALTFTIFGSTGDLTYRKLLPALYQLEARNLLDSNLIIRCIGRRDLTTQSYLENAKSWIEKGARFPFDDSVYERFIKHIYYVNMSLTELEAYESLKPTEEGRDYLYYFAVAPEFFELIANHLKQSGVMNKGQHRIILEKPFGSDETHARYLNERLGAIFGQANIYRIDHYLGKEMIQNILTIRFSNRLFEGIWNKDYIQEIQITASETIGIENRGAYYEQTGAIQDMVQNHLLQLLSYVLMDQPTDLKPMSIQAKQVEILSHIKLSDLVLGQYDHTQQLNGYREEQKVALTSETETFVALKLNCEVERYAGIPIYLRTGKRLDQKATYITVVFKPTDGSLYKNLAPLQEMLIIKIQPDEGVYFRFNAKKPGIVQQVAPVMMNFCQSCIYENRINTPEAYERLLNEAFQQDKTLFTSWEMVDLSWSFASKLEHFKDEHHIQLQRYPAESQGPLLADEMLKHAGSMWIPAKITEEAIT